MTNISELKDRLRKLNKTYRSVSDLKEGQSVIATGTVRVATKDEVDKIRRYLDAGKQPLRMMASKGIAR